MKPTQEATLHNVSVSEILSAVSQEMRLRTCHSQKCAVSPCSWVMVLTLHCKSCGAWWECLTSITLCDKHAVQPWADKAARSLTMNSPVEGHEVDVPRTTARLVNIE